MSVPTGYTLVYGEEFDGTSLPSPWQLGYYFSNTVPSSAVTVSGGALHLTWSSGGVSDISVSSTQTFHYGYFEVRMKWTVSNGAWPAFWFIPPSGIAHTGEIDVFEGQGNDSGGYFATLHEWNGSTQLWQSTPNRFPISTDFAQYHTYALLWEPGGVFSWYFDDVLIHTETIPDHTIFDTQSVFPILSMQEGNNWSVGNTSGVSASTLTTDVDYFRVYQGTTGSSTGTGGGGTSGTASSGPFVIGPAVPTNSSGLTYGYMLGDSPTGQFGLQHGSYVYTFLCQGNYGDYGIHAFRSATGATWDEMDSSNAPLLGPGGSYTVYTTAVDGDTVWLINVLTNFHSSPVSATLVDAIKAVSFNLSTGTWGSVATLSPGWLPGFARGSQVVVKLVVRGPGDMILLFSAPQETISGTAYGRCAYATFDGSSLGSLVAFSGQSGEATNFKPISATVDSSGNTHFFYYAYGAFISGGGQIRHWAINSSGTFGTEQTMSWAAGFIDGTVSEPIVYMDGGVQHIAFASYASSTVDSMVLAYASSALNPTWSVSTIATYPEVAYPQGFDLIPAAINIAYQSGAMNVAYTWYDEDLSRPPQTRSHQPYTVVKLTSASTATWAWSTPAILLSPPILPPEHTTNAYELAWCAYQLSLFSSDLGVGIIVISDDDFDYPLAQFFLLGTGSSSSGNGPTPPITFLCIMFDSLGKLRLANTTTDPVSLVT